MTNLTSQRRLASRILKVGKNRVWINPDKIEDSSPPSQEKKCVS